MPPSPVSLAARDLDVLVDGRTLVTNAQLTVAPGTRLALVGPNGAGKSLLLRTLAGHHPPGGGRVERHPAQATVGYLPQEATPSGDETGRELLARRTGVAAAQQELDRAIADLATDGSPTVAQRYAERLDRWLNLGGADLDTRAEAVVDDLGLSPALLNRPATTYSGGQAARVQLASILLAQFDVLLLDEPTNDLDYDGLERLESFVDGQHGPLVVVSHDRAFLERTATAVAEVTPHDGSLIRYDGGWQAYLDERQRARAREADAHRAYVERRDHLREQARRQQEWSNRGARAARRSGETDKHIRHGANQGAQRMAGRARQTVDALNRLEQVPKPWEGWELRIDIAEADRSGTTVATLAGAVVHLHTNDQASEQRGSGTARDVFSLGPVDLEVLRGDRVAVTGPNGAGKSTLLAALLGRQQLTAGHQHLGPNVVVGEVGQQRDTFVSDRALLAEFQSATGTASASTSRSVLAKFGLGADHVLRPARSLSPGERTRASLASFQARGVNTLVLDEPTNHLDLPAIEQLEAALAAFTGTLLVVSHDRRLLAALACTRYLTVEAGEVREADDVTPMRGRR